MQRGLETGWVSDLFWQDEREAHAVSVTTPTAHSLEASVGAGEGGGARHHLFQDRPLPRMGGVQGAFQTQDGGRTGRFLGTTEGGGRIGNILVHDEVSRYDLDVSS